MKSIILVIISLVALVLAGCSNKHKNQEVGVSGLPHKAFTMCPASGSKISFLHWTKSKEPKIGQWSDGVGNPYPTSQPLGTFNAVDIDYTTGVVVCSYVNSDQSLTPYFTKIPAPSAGAFSTASKATCGKVGSSPSGTTANDCAWDLSEQSKGSVITCPKTSAEAQANHWQQLSPYPPATFPVVSLVEYQLQGTGIKVDQSRITCSYGGSTPSVVVFKVIDASDYTTAPFKDLAADQINSVTCTPTNGDVSSCSVTAK